MSLTATYAADLSRVRLVVAGAPASADYALIERSADGGITWATVRGGDQVPLNAGAAQLDDYEFAASVLNTYRATYVDSSSPSIVGIGAASSGDNTPVTPTLPAGLVEGDLLLLKAAIRSTSATVDTPAGWSLWTDGANFRLFARTYTAGVVAPNVTFTGGAAGDDTVARILAVRNAGPAAWTFLSNASAQDIPVPGIAAADIRPNLMIRLAWKQAASTSSNMAGWTFISRDSVTAGNDETVLWWSLATSSDVPGGTLTVAGGAAAVSKSATLRITRAAYVSRETATVTPALNAVWLKNTQRPYLNRTVVVTDWSDIERPARSGVFDIVGRSYPVAVTELRGGRRYTLTVTTPTLDLATELDGILSAGEPVFLHTPPGCPFPGGYYIIGDTSVRRSAARRSERRYFDLPLVEVAAPDGTLVGSTITWQGVVNAFATWSDVIAAEPTWSDLLDRIGTPADVVVP